MIDIIQSFRQTTKDNVNYSSLCNIYFIFLIVVCLL